MDLVDASCDSETVKISLPWTWRPVKRRMLPGCEFFRDGDTAMQVARKLIPLENHDGDAQKSDGDSCVATVPCSVLGCSQTFTSLLRYENHYKSVHRHSCVSCQRTFPSAHLLDVHLQENHDPLFAILSARQPMYQCLVESCRHKFPNPDTRRQHMIEVHSYPANFRFHRLTATHRRKATQSHTASGRMDADQPSPSPAKADNSHTPSDGMTVPSPSPSKADNSYTPADGTSVPSSSPSKADNSHTPADGTSVPSPSPSKADNSHPATDSRSATVPSPGERDDREVCRAGGEGKPAEGESMEVSEAGMQMPRRVFVHKVPKNFTFGHGVSRGFQRPPGKKKGKKGGHWHQRGTGETSTNIENVDMTDMADALSDAL
ncbi:uncharacterized protein LOC143277306 isoform X2 [Babylonia areolata]|uniref:uncharacterized protein LOC143277306 isoform X2 n=1 Tax=Babylonia areolata TaxID=304850 RepID=UPI003FD24D43